MSKVTVIAAFEDKVEGVIRKVGEQFEADAKRIAELNACGPEQNGMPLVKVEDEKPASKPERKVNFRKPEPEPEAEAEEEEED